jgi:hypothetical protein
MHESVRVTTLTQQSDAAKQRWLKLNSDQRRDATEAAREGRRERYRQQLPPGLDHDEVERRVDELIAIDMRTMARRRHAAEKKANDLAAEAAGLEAALNSPAG